MFRYKSLLASKFGNFKTDALTRSSEGMNLPQLQKRYSIHAVIYYINLRVNLLLNVKTCYHTSLFLLPSYYVFHCLLVILCFC